MFAKTDFFYVTSLNCSKTDDELFLRDANTRLICIAYHAYIKQSLKIEEK